LTRHVAQSALTRQEYRELQEHADELEYRKLGQSQDFTLLKRFHDGGIKQVADLKGEVIRYS